MDKGPLHKFLVVFVSTICILSAGCSQWNYQLGTTLSDKQIPQGRPLFRSEVMALFGPPHKVSQNADGYVLAWEYLTLQENSFGFGLGPLGLEFISLDISRIDARGEFLLATFSPDHMMTSVHLSDWSSEASDSRSVQPFGAFDGISSSDLRESPAQHSWGHGLLQRLPEGLNASSDVDSAEHGLEQRGTPTTLGQRTLELR